MTDNPEFDSLGKWFHQKLAHHQVPVDQQMWDEIEQRLTQPRRKVAVWFWQSGTAAAAALIVVLLLLNRTTPLETATTTILQQEPTASSSPERILFAEAEKIAAVEYTLETPPPASIQSATKQHATNPSTTNPPATEPPTTEPPATTHQVVDKPIPDIFIAEKGIRERTAPRREGSWQFVASFGAGEGRSESPSYTSVLSSASLDPTFQKSDGNRYAAALSGSILPFDRMDKRDFTNIRHLPPLSFSIMVQKSLGGRVGIESGLIYTYLDSRFNWQGYDVRQQLHYIGIPVNLIAYLWRATPHWRVYLSTGVAAEKGLRAIYQQERRQNNEIHRTIIKSSIDGWQYSLNGALGIHYQVSNHFGFHFEPRFGYCFEGNQPLSMRTEWPLFVGFGMGLRYQL